LSSASDVSWSTDGSFVRCRLGAGGQRLTSWLNSNPHLGELALVHLSRMGLADIEFFLRCRLVGVARKRLIPGSRESILVVKDGGFFFFFFFFFFFGETVIMDRQEPQAAAKIGIAFTVAPEADIVRVPDLSVFIGVSDNQLICRDASPVKELEPYPVLVLILAAAGAGVSFLVHVLRSVKASGPPISVQPGDRCDIDLSYSVIPLSG